MRGERHTKEEEYQKSSFSAPGLQGRAQRGGVQPEGGNLNGERRINQKKRIRQPKPETIKKSNKWIMQISLEQGSNWSVSSLHTGGGGSDESKCLKPKGGGKQPMLPKVLGIFFSGFFELRRDHGAVVI